MDATAAGMLMHMYINLSMQGSPSCAYLQPPIQELLGFGYCWLLFDRSAAAAVRAALHAVLSAITAVV
jgi:hypothetical protein